MSPYEEKNFLKPSFEKRLKILVGAPELLLFNPYHNQSFSNGADSVALGVGFLKEEAPERAAGLDALIADKAA